MQNSNQKTFLFFALSIVSICFKTNAQNWCDVGGLNSLSANNFIQSICLDNSNNIYASGQFTNTSGKNYVAKFDGSNWNELGGLNSLSANNWITNITKDAYDNVYVAGEFTNNGNFPYVAKWDGNSWTQLGDMGISFPYNQYTGVTALFMDKIGNIYATGGFRNSAYKFFVSKYNGTTWSELGGLNSLSPNDVVRCICSDSSGNIYVAGDFTNANGKKYVAKFDGTTWTELGGVTNGLKANGTIYSLCIDNVGNIYAAGNFTNSTGYRYVAKWNGTDWNELGNILSIAPLGPGTIFKVYSDIAGIIYIPGPGSLLKFNGTSWSLFGGFNSLSDYSGGFNASTFSINSDKYGNIYTTGQNSTYKFYVAKFGLATWKGTTSSNWQTSLNWNPPIVPPNGDNILIPNGTLYLPTLNTTRIVNNLTIDSLGGLNLSGHLQIGGIINNRSSFFSNTGTVTLYSISAQTIPPNTFSSNTIKNLNINNSAGVNLGGTLNITGTLTPTLGTLTTNGNLVLKSSATGTASVASGNGAISGNVTVERYIPAYGRKAYTFVSSPVNNPSIYNAWQENGIATTGYGTQITGPTGTSVASGFDATSASGFASVFTYNDNNSANNKWVSLTNTKTNTLGAGKGYLLYVRGDRTVLPGAATISNTVLRATGTLTSSTYNATGLLTGAGKFTLVANPYPCTIDWLSAGITKTQLSNFFTVYDPANGVFVTSDGTTVSPSASAQQPRYIQSGQAFFVQNNATGTAPALSITEAAKSTGAATAVSNTVFGNDAVTARLNLNVYRVADSSLADGAVALFAKTFHAAEEGAGKFTNFNETFSLARNGKLFGIEKRALAASDTLFLHLANFDKRQYRLVIDGSNFSNMNATLEDRYTRIKLPLDLTATTTHDFAVNNEEGSSAADRFIITFGSRPKELITDATGNKLFVTISPNPVKHQMLVSFTTEKTAPIVIRIINSDGREVKHINAGNTSNGKVTIAAAALPSGSYIVQLVSDNKTIAVQKIIKE